MCGVAGFLETQREFVTDGMAVLEQMCNRIQPRGPDSFGYWRAPNARVYLGHRRLAVVDLSEAGHQPMVSASGRYTVVYNGEIYNHLELRATLPRQSWRGHSDTETLLAGLEAWGFEATLKRLVGMFAIAVWDAQERCLLLARDRMGEKPLYVSRQAAGQVLFASTLSALKAHPSWQDSIDRGALALYLRHNCVPAPYSIYNKTRKLEPGCWLSIGEDGEEKTGRYWDLLQVARPAAHSHELLTGAEADAAAVAELEHLLTQSVQGQMLSDVPLGAFLSGGVDSSTIVALMAKLSPGKVKTFAIGFAEEGFDEAQYAKAVAQHLGTDHTELYASAQDALDVIPKLPQIYDEPFADSSQIPTYLVCALARSEVTVALSGDAGDELFAGYTRYGLGHGLWRRLSPAPLALRQLAARGILSVSPAGWHSAYNAVMSVAGRQNKMANFGDRLHKFASTILTAESDAEMYRSLVSHWSEPEKVVLGAKEPKTWITDPRIAQVRQDFVERMCLSDQLTYLPDDILTKVDRAAMAVSLETRIPLLDHRIVEYAWRTPLHRKLRDGQSKWLLRQVLYKHVPRHLIERPKQGFGIPLDSWLRGPLREWASDLLAEHTLRRQGYFDAALIAKHWKEHLSGARNWQYQLWDVLMFQSWLNHQESNVSQ